MIVYGSSLSPYVRKVLAFAAEKGIEIELRRAGPGERPAEFLDASPFGKMPALVDGDYCLADSSAIVHYLDATAPEPALIPADPKLRGKTVWFDEFADTILFDCGRTIFFNRIVAPRFLGREGDDAAAAKAQAEQLPAILDYLEQVAPDEGGFLVGDALTLADIAVAGPFANLDHCGVQWDEDRHPRTRAFVERILARPTFAHWVERERAFLEKTEA